MGCMARKGNQWEAVGDPKRGQWCLVKFLVSLSFPHKQGRIIYFSKQCPGTSLAVQFIKTLCSQCRGCGFSLRSVNYDPTCCMVQPKNKKKKRKRKKLKQNKTGTSLVVQWLRIRLPMQGTQFRSLVGELRSHITTGQLSPRHNYWARALESQCATTREKSARHNEEYHRERSRMPQQRSHVPQLRPYAAKKKKERKKINNKIK